MHGVGIVYLFEIEFVAEHPLTVLTHPRLSRLPGGPEQSRHLVRAQQGGHLVSSAGPVHTLRWKMIFRVIIRDHVIILSYQEIERRGARHGEQRGGEKTQVRAGARGRGRLGTVLVL